MSSVSSLVTREHFDYLAARTRRDDGFLEALKEAARAAGIPAIWIAPEQASLMQILLKASQARQVLEIGTLAGYSAISMARALPADGRLCTIEVSDKHADFAEQWIGRSDVAGKIQLLRGAAQAVLSKLPDRSFDAAFLDADKKSYPVYLGESARLLRPGGLLLVDNAFAFGQLLDREPTDPEVESVRSFNDLMAADERFHSVILPIGDGLWIGVRS